MFIDQPNWWCLYQLYLGMLCFVGKEMCNKKKRKEKNIKSCPARWTVNNRTFSIRIFIMSIDLHLVVFLHTGIFSANWYTLQIQMHVELKYWLGHIFNWRWYLPCMIEKVTKPNWNDRLNRAIFMCCYSVDVILNITDIILNVVIWWNDKVTVLILISKYKTIQT